MKTLTPGQYGQEVCRRVTKKTGVKVLITNYIHWLEGGATYNKFDKAVKKLFTKQQLRSLEIAARVPDGLDYILGLSKGTRKECGGVNVAALMKAGR